MKILLITLAAFFLLTCTTEEETVVIDVVDLIPLDNEISGWVRFGTMQVAENETQLWALINGAGQVYLDHGFIKCAFQDFQGQVLGNPRTIAVRAFDLGTPTNAQETYHDNRLESGSEILWTDPGHAGTEARTETALGFHTIEFWEERFYVDIVIDDDTQEGLNVAKFFAINVSETIRQLSVDPEM